MTRLVVLLVVLLVEVVPPQQVFRSVIDGVTIHASVRVGDRPIGGLTTADFELRDNGVVQEITSVSVESVPLDLTLLLDISGSVDGPVLERLKAAVQDTARLLRGEDRIRLVVVSQVLREVAGFQPRARTLALDGLVAAGATSLYDGLGAAMMQPSEPGRRQLVVAFTDGRDSTSITDEQTAQEIARLSDVVVDIVVPVNAPGRPDVTTRGRPRSMATAVSDAVAQSLELSARAAGQPPGSGEAVVATLRGLVTPTAGQVFTLNSGDSIAKVFQGLIDDFRASYILQYVPRGVAAPGWHDVVVIVKKPGRYDIRARKGYAGR